jgi:hypothetical protein
VTPLVTIEEAVALAAGEKQTYIRVTGRISSDEEFPDEHDRPLVYRHSRIELLGSAGQWTTQRDEREAVPFGVETRGAFIAVDQNALGDGLVVVPRVAEGVAADLAPVFDEPLPEGSRPADRARLTIEQLSAVEHATVCGQPVQRGDGPLITAGLGRPLIVTTLEAPAAMRLLARDHRGRVLGASILLVLGLALSAAAVASLLLGA